MQLDEAFHQYKDKIVDQWVEYMLSTYISSGFFKKEKDLFANPVGTTTRHSLETLYPLLVKGADAKELAEPLEQLIKIRSVQEFTASQAVAPINGVKHITREVFQANKETKQFVNDLYDFEFAVDLAMLAAFDLYANNREQIYKVRIKEIKSGSHILTDSKCPSAML